MIVDISNPQNLLLLSTTTINAAGKTARLALSYPYVFIGEGGNKLQVFDVSDPANPQQIGNGFSLTGDAQRIKIVGNKAYVTDFVKGEKGHLRVIDASDPAYSARDEQT